MPLTTSGGWRGPADVIAVLFYLLGVVLLTLTTFRYTGGMQENIYNFTVPLFINNLTGLKNILRKAKEHGLNEQALLADRLAPDMFPFIKQVQVACDNAKGATARLAGLEAPTFEDTEASLDELQTRIDKTIAYVQSVDQALFAEAATRRITLPYFGGKYFTGFDYVRDYVLPNFYFHISMAYALVRKNEVPVGKMDYVNNLTLNDE